LSLYGNTVAFDRHNNYTKAIGARTFLWRKSRRQFHWGKKSSIDAAVAGHPTGAVFICIHLHLIVDVFGKTLLTLKIYSARNV